MPGAGIRYGICCGRTLPTPSVTATTCGSSLAARCLPDTGGRYTVRRVNICRVTAELPDILAGQAPTRRNQSDRVFVFNSGMAITDVPVAHALATQTITRGRGQEIRLWY
jgi:hypothetical protein